MPTPSKRRSPTPVSTPARKRISNPEHRKRKQIVPASYTLDWWQKDGVNWLYKNERAILADDMGLGKTVQAVVTATAVGSERIVILTASNVVAKWAYEWKEWSITRKKLSVIYSGNDTPDEYTQVIIMSYDIARQPRWTNYLQKFLATCPNNLLICDEAQQLANWTAKRTQIIAREISIYAKRLMLLTATPMPKDVSDLHPLLSMVQPGRWGSFKSFCQRYMYEVVDPMRPDGVGYEGLRNTKELKRRLEQCFLRRLEKNTTKLQPVQHFNVFFDCAEENRASMDDLMQEAASIEHAIEQDEEPSYENYNLAQAANELAQLKLAPGIKFIKKFRKLHPGEPLVVFGYHKEFIDQLYKWGKSQGIPTARIHGGIPQKQRGEVYKKFQAGEFELIVCNIVAAGIGIDLHYAKYAVVAELVWSPSVIAQAIGRLQRKGQKGQVVIYYWIMNLSIDQVVISVLRKKLRETRMLFSPKKIAHSRSGKPGKINKRNNTESENIRPRSRHRNEMPAYTQ